MSSATVGIVGAGLTGLALAYELAKQGTEFIVLEAEAEPGGVIRTIEREGRVLELGPQRTRLTPDIEALIRELGLDDEVVTAPPGLPLLVYRAGRLRRVPFSLAEAVRTDLISPIGKARVLLEPIMPGERADESVAAFLTRKFGREAYETMLGPLYGGLYASDPKDMLMRHTLSRALQNFRIEGSLLLTLARRSRSSRGTTPACSFQGGLRTLTDALAAANEERVRLSTPVHKIGRTHSGYRLETHDGPIDCEHVVLTTPADVSATLLAGLEPDTANRLGTLTYNPLAVVHLIAECSTHAMGYQVAFGEPLETRGVSFNHSLFGREGVYTVYLGGARSPEIVEAEDAEIGRVAVEEFSAVTGGSARVLNVSRVRMPAWDRSWAALDGLELPDGVHLAANYESRAGIPGRLARAAGLAAALN